MTELFERFVDAKGNYFYLHNRAFREIEDTESPVFVNRNNVPEPSQSTTHTKEFENFFDDCLLYARLTMYQDTDSGESLYYGTVRGNTEPVYLGIGKIEDIKNRAKDYRYFKSKLKQTKN